MDRPQALDLQDPNPLRCFIPTGTSRADKDLKTRLTLFCDYQADLGTAWYRPDLAGWRDRLLAAGLSAASVKAYLSTVRGVYRQLLRDNTVRDGLYQLTPA